MQEPIALRRNLLDAFQVSEEQLTGTGNAAIHQLRRDALQAFNVKGFPTTKDEEWKYTNIQPLLKEGWELGGTDDTGSIDHERIKPFLSTGIKSNLLVFVNGRHITELSVLIDNDIVCCSIAEAFGSHPDIISAHYAKYLPSAFNAFTALNTALAEQGAFIYISKGLKAEFPIRLLFLSGCDEDHVFRQIRNLIVAEEEAECTLIESTHSLGNTASFTNIVTEMSVASNAKLTYHKLQIENSDSSQVNTTQVYQAKDSHCDTSTITLGGKVVRNDLNFMLDGRNCESHMYGLYIPAGHEHFDNHTFADHAKPDCFSNEFYKGIILDSANAVFNGKILVRQDAQKTNAYQSNKNVLLSPEARVETKPQLEIFADDVKCSHGATVGQLDEEALFYIRSRGIGEDEAKALLTYAYAADVLQNIKLPEYRTYIDMLIQQKLNSR